VPNAGRRALVGLALAVGAVCATLAVAEGLARLADALREPRPTPKPDPRYAGLPELHGIAELARPNVRGLHGSAFYRTNSAGFRGPEVDPVAAPGTFRIALIGDSYTMGWQIGEEEIYASRVQEALNAAALPGHRFEVLNLGLGGLNIGQIVRRLERIGLRFSPDLIVYGYTLNDILVRDLQPEADPERQREAVAEWFRFADSPSHLLRLLWPRWVSLRNAIWRPPGSEEHSLQAMYADPEHWRRVEAGLDRLAAIGRREGVCVHVLIHTEVGQLRFLHPFTNLYDQVEAAAKARGFSVTQSFPYYRGRNANDLRISPFDGHPNAEGHRLLAEALLDGLRKLPQRCGLPL
jgi:lysophospholipase L1-like esterase